MSLKVPKSINSDAPKKLLVLDLDETLIHSIQTRLITLPPALMVRPGCVFRRVDFLIGNALAEGMKGLLGDQGNR